MVMNIYWIGGSPCSGKSSIADLLAKQYGWQVYHCDEAFDRHVQRADAVRHPWLSKVPHIVWDAFWMRSLEVQLRNVIEAYAEEFSMILDDLRALPADRPILVEGTALLPELLADIGVDGRRAIWLIPAPEFQRVQYPRRGAWVQAILEQCSQPQQALTNWMDRDIETGRHIQREAEARGLKVLTVDGVHSIEENTQMVMKYFLGGIDK
jgi:2-phosphoglycerate kinase